VLKNKIEIVDFEEYNIEMANNAVTQLFDKFPLSYSLIGEKK
jgi:hypothetical protein